MSRHASRKPNRKYKVPQHERAARNKRRFQAQQKARKDALDEQKRTLDQIKDAVGVAA